MNHGELKVPSPFGRPSSDTQNLVLSELSLFIPPQNIENKILGLQYIGAWLQYIGAPKCSWLFIHFLKDQFAPAVIKILGRQITSPSAKPLLTCCGCGKSMKIELSFSLAECLYIWSCTKMENHFLFVFSCGQFDLSGGTGCQLSKCWSPFPRCWPRRLFLGKLSFQLMPLWKVFVNHCRLLSTFSLIVH